MPASAAVACMCHVMLRAGAWLAADVIADLLQGMVSTPPSLRTALLLGATVARRPMGLTPTRHRRRAALVAHQAGGPRRGKSWLTVSRLYVCCICLAAAAAWPPPASEPSGQSCGLHDWACLARCCLPPARQQPGPLCLPQQPCLMGHGMQVLLLDVPAF